MYNYKVHLKTAFYRFLFAVFLFFIARLFFFVNNYITFGKLPIIEILRIFFFGMRFDIFVISWVSGLFFILMLLPGGFKNNPTYQFFLKIGFVLVNSLLLLANLADSEYFKFTRKRASAYIFDIMGFGNMEADATRLIPKFIVDFWYIPLTWLVFTFLIWRLYPRLKYEKLRKTDATILNISLQSVILVIICGIILIGARGGLQMKPLRIINATEHTEPQNTPFILNTPFTILKTLGKSKLKERSDFAESEIDAIYNPVKQFKENQLINKKNIVVIILESFGCEYIGSLSGNETYTPFLDSLIANSLTFTNAYANGTQSIEALPSILAGIPSLMDNPYIPSYYSSNKLDALPTILKREGYKTSLFHGLTNGSMGFDHFAHVAGIEKYYGRNEYNNEKDYDGRWGIFDEEFLQYTAGELNKTQQPFFSCVMTLSSHHPYTLREKYKNKFTKGKIPIHNVVSYADFALKRFFETASQMPWYNNTLFILTADHTGPSLSKYYKNDIGRFAVPVIYFCPGDTTLKGMNNTVTQQTDIMPSVLNYIHYNKPFLAFGKSIFDKTTDAWSLNYLAGVYQLIQDDYVLFFDGSHSIGLYNLKTDRDLTQNILSENQTIAKAMELKVKAIIQQYNNRLIKDQLTINQIK